MSAGPWSSTSAACGDCALELDQLRLTTAALRTLPDREIPQRIAFVSDQVFEPSRVRGDSGTPARGSGLPRPVCWRRRWLCRPGISLRLPARGSSYGCPDRASGIRLGSNQCRRRESGRASQDRKDAQMIQAAVRTSEQKHDAGISQPDDRDGGEFRRAAEAGSTLSYASLASNDIAGPERVSETPAADRGRHALFRSHRIAGFAEPPSWRSKTASTKSSAHRSADPYDCWATHAAPTSKAMARCSRSNWI